MCLLWNTQFLKKKKKRDTASFKTLILGHIWLHGTSETSLKFELYLRAFCAAVSVMESSVTLWCFRFYFYFFICTTVKLATISPIPWAFCRSVDVRFKLLFSLMKLSIKNENKINQVGCCVFLHCSRDGWREGPVGGSSLHI